MEGGAYTGSSSSDIACFSCRVQDMLKWLNNNEHNPNINPARKLACSVGLATRRSGSWSMMSGWR